MFLKFLISYLFFFVSAHDLETNTYNTVYNNGFGFASSFQENMVLQMKPYSAVLWGYGTVGSIVNISLVQDVYSTKVIEGLDGKGVWKVILKPQSAGGPHTFQGVQDNHGLLSWILLKNILFGDVWICGGQSNMQFTVSMATNASLELNQTANYSHIRVMTPAEVQSEAPLYDFKAIEQPWSVPSLESIGGPTWTYFSAVCWFYGKYLYDQLKVPIGLISPNWGGTPIECWSSPEALQNCGINVQKEDKMEYLEPKFFDPVYPINNSVLWNAMIVPLLNMTIKGVIWYQGEQNMHYHNAEYACSFPAMIQDWRKAWFLGSHGQTDPQFPFGFVQLSAFNFTEDASFPLIRWHQTADYGFVPNVKMPSTFMAVAVDLGDPSSPFGSIHPRDKQDVARRLVRGSLSIAYNRSVHFQGPIPKKAIVNDSVIVLTYKSLGKLKVSKRENFEVCCSYSVCDYSKPFNMSGWHSTSILSHSSKTVTITAEKCSSEKSKPVMVRYAWQMSPCHFKKCSIYDSDDLPAPPYVLLVAEENDLENL